MSACAGAGPQRDKPIVAADHPGLRRERAPLKRTIDAAEVADTAVFLVSQAARGITGEVVMVDAGYHVIGL